MIRQRSASLVTLLYPHHYQHHLRIFLLQRNPESGKLEAFWDSNYSVDKYLIPDSIRGIE